MKKLIFICLLVLMGCSQASNTSSCIKDSGTIVSCEGKDNSNSASNENSNLVENTTYSASKSSSLSSKVTSSAKETSKNSNVSSKESYNPDGSKALPKPSKTVSTWSQQETIYDFERSFPSEFSYIYGHQILKNPYFYSDGGWRISFPNSSARMGFQTPIFNTDLKIEIRLYIAGIYNSNNKIDKNTPFITIYGFDESGKLIRTLEVENLKNFYNYKNSSTPLNIYFNGENISYMELRFTSAPYKSSQCYNFGIKRIGFKTFPYQLEKSN